MRLGIMIRDTEYRDALIQKICSYDNNIFVNIIGNNVKDASGCIILTDIPPSSIEETVLNALKPRTLFIVSSGNDIRGDCNVVFKFSSIPEIISELSLVNDRWRGHGPGVDKTSRLITVLSESDSYSSECCKSLAGQIIYSHGGNVLILPLSFINDYGVNYQLGSNSLSRLLYSIERGRDRGFEEMTYTDSYGVSTLLLTRGRNPVAYLDEDELRLLVSGLSKKFDTIIADSASCFRSENIEIMKESDNLIFFERGRRVTGIESILGDAGREKLIRVKLTGGTEGVIAMDECLKKIYGEKHNESNESRDNKEIRK